MSDFSYFNPTSLQEAFELIRDFPEKMTLVAGGTDLFRKMKKGLLAPSGLMNLRDIPELKNLRFSPQNGLRIGSMVTIGEIEKNPIIAEHYPILQEVAYRFGTYQVRSTGTIGGNICNASPAADYASVLLALDAKLLIYSIDDRMLIPIDKFFKTTGETFLLPDEILGEIIIPPPNKLAKISIKRYSTREVLDVAILSVCIWMLFSDNLCTSARIGMCSVAPTPIRSYNAEKILEGKQLSTKVIEDCIASIQQDISPISDFRGSAKYRRSVLSRFIQSTLEDWSIN